MRQIGEGLQKELNFQIDDSRGEQPPCLIYQWFWSCRNMSRDGEKRQGDNGEKINLGMPLSDTIKWHTQQWILPCPKDHERRRLFIQWSFSYNEDTTIGDELLIQTKIIWKYWMLPLIRYHGLAHITGSGLMKLHPSKYGFDIRIHWNPNQYSVLTGRRGMWKTLNA